MIIRELIAHLSKYPEDTPVMLPGYEGDWATVHRLRVRRLIHVPNAPYYVGDFKENRKGMRMICLQSKPR